MLSLWSRAAQIRNVCHCPQCLHSAQAVARRATNVGTVLQLRYQSTGKAWSSGNPAVAATCSGRVRSQKRRRQWAQAVDEASSPELRRTFDKEDETHNGAAGCRKSLVEEHPTTGGQDANPGAHLRSVGGITTYAEELSTEFPDVSDDLDADLERNLDSTAEREYIPTWPTNTGPQLQRHHLPPQSIYTVRRRKREAATKRWHEKKLLRVQLSMDMLQLKFFIWLHARGRVHRFVSSIPEYYAELILQHPRVLQRVFERKKSDFDRLLSTHKDENGYFVFARSPGDVPICHYAEDDLGTFRVQQRELQQSIKRTFDDIHEQNLTGTEVTGAGWDHRMRGLVGIFWRLSVSSAPPSLDVYNTLINGLRQERHVHLTESVVSCFLSSRMRPNEVSLASILGFYTDTDNVERFRRWILLMRGDMGGLMASAPWNWRFEASNGRIKEREDKPGVLIQMPHPTPIVFDALVRGVLHFSGFGAALDLCRNLSNEGWGMDMRGFGILLNDCAIRADWDSGFAIWNQILALKQKSAKLVDGRVQTETMMTPLFANMLRLCRRCNKKHEFADVWAEASKTHPKAIHRIMDIIKAESGTAGQRPSAGGSDEVTTAAVLRHEAATSAAGTLANDREQALEALAKLRAQRMDSTNKQALQQEYLALKADIDFLKSLEVEGAASKPKAHTWSDLVKSVYDLIASHPDTFERRHNSHRTAEPMRASDDHRPLSYFDLVKSAYHLVTDHPSTFKRRNSHSQLLEPIDHAERHIRQPLSCEPSTISSHATSDEAASSRAADQGRDDDEPTHPQQGLCERITYTAHGRSASPIIADHPSTLKPRVSTQDSGNLSVPGSAGKGPARRSSGGTEGPRDAHSAVAWP